MANKYTDEKLLNILKNKAKSLGQTPTIREVITDEQMPHLRTYTHRFGSWEKAIALAGLQYRERLSYSDEDLLTKLKGFASRVKRVPTRRDIDASGEIPSWITYVKRFGNWDRALERAGISKKTKSEVIEEKRERALSLLREFYREKGRLPRMKDFAYSKNYGVTDKTIIKYFGGWNKAIEAAGLRGVVARPLWKRALVYIWNYLIKSH